jgi:hypothetical protein
MRCRIGDFTLAYFRESHFISTGFGDKPSENEGIAMSKLRELLDVGDGPTARRRGPGHWGELRPGPHPKVGRGCAPR